ncbi:hypothetical protein JXQ70_07570 [bacterium]|nr:hypothetical protein [bacterium]
MKEILPWQTAITISLIISILVTGGCLLFPFLRVLNHELAQLFTFISFLVLLFLSARLVKTAVRQNQHLNRLYIVQRCFSPIILAAVCLLGTFLAIVVLFNLFGPQCRVSPGLPYLIITWVPAALFACVLGATLGAWRAHWLIILLVFLVILFGSIAHDLLQLVLGWRVVDCIVGFPSAIDQRADMTIPEIHLFQRLFILILCAIVWYFNAWLIGRQDQISQNKLTKNIARDRFIVLSIIALLLVVFAGSFVGIGWGHQALHFNLDEQTTSEHFIFRYKRGGFAENYLSAIIRNAEWSDQQFSGLFGTSSAEPVKVYLFDDWQDLKKQTGLGDHAGLRTIYIYYRYAITSTFLHELVHARHMELKPRYAIMMNRGMVEGLAMAIEENFAFNAGAHQSIAAVYQESKMPSIQTLLSILGFWSMDEHNAYKASGSFIGYLLLKHGSEKMVQLQQSYDFNKAYGKNLEELEQEWHRFLGELPVNLEQRLIADETFDTDLRPGYFQTCCPKLGKKYPSLEDRAQSLCTTASWSTNQYIQAHELYLALYQQEPKTIWLQQATQCLRKAGQCEQALSLLTEALAQTGLDPLDKIRLLTIKIACLLKLGNWPGLETALAELESSPTNAPASEWYIIRAGLADPELQNTLAIALSTDDTCIQRQMLWDLINNNPDDKELHYLALVRILKAFRSYRTNLALEKDRLLEIIELVRPLPNMGSDLGQILLSFCDEALMAQEYVLAHSIAQVLIEPRQSTDEYILFQAQKHIEKIDFFKNYKELP